MVSAIYCVSNPTRKEHRGTVEGDPDISSVGGSAGANENESIIAVTAEVLGITDDHETLPTPYFIMEALTGEAVAYERVVQLEDEALRRLARELGEYLAELHSISVLENFGHVHHDGPALTGERPSGDPEILTIDDPYTDWPTSLQAYGTRELDRHANALSWG